MGYTHDTQCVVYDGPDTPYQGRELCFSANETAITIADVTDKTNPQSIAIAGYPQVGYAHQGWLSTDQRFFFQNDETDEIAGSVTRTRTLVWDVTVLEDPILVEEHLGETMSSDHNLYIRDDLMYQSNYGSGLRMRDVSEPVSPFEVGFFDSVPGDDDRPGLSGSWSNFPFFESGVIVFTSQSEGLFVVRRSP
jgi:choice-of-anchor B domain-containing protein